MLAALTDGLPAGPGTFFSWGPVVISLGNLTVIGSMLALFALALLIPFPPDRHRR